MRLFLDCEFNGFGGDLLSMAIVTEDSMGPQFYREIKFSGILNSWVADNVVPLFDQEAVDYEVFQQDLCAFLSDIDDINVVVDWPDDIRYFCEAVITGPGERMHLPNPIRFTMDTDIDGYDSMVPHHALHDACAIRNTYMDTIIGEEPA